MVLYVAYFGVISVLFSPSMCLDDIIKIKVAEWLPFGKKLFIRLTICSFCVLSFCNTSIVPISHTILCETIGNHITKLYTLYTLRYTKCALKMLYIVY